MDNYNHNEFHWWHWLIIVIMIVLVIAGLWMLTSNYQIVRKNNQTFTNGIERTINHPIDTTQNIVRNIAE